MTKNGGLMFAGRENELKILNCVFLSKRQESVLIYGRRRIGKTELIKRPSKILMENIFTVKVRTLVTLVMR